MAAELRAQDAVDRRRAPRRPPPDADRCAATAAGPDATADAAPRAGAGGVERRRASEPRLRSPRVDDRPPRWVRAVVWLYSPDHERQTHRPPRRPAPAPQGRDRGQLRQVPPRAARRPDRLDAPRPRRRARGAAAGRGGARLRHRGRGHAPRARQPARSSARAATTATSRAACRSRATSPTSRAARRSGSSPRTASARRSRSPAPGSSAGRSSTSWTTSTASSTSTTSTRWTS